MGKEEWALWLAALIDGEGSIMLNKRTHSAGLRQPTKPIYRPVISVANTDYRLMEALVSRTGIERVYEHKVSNTAKSFNPRKRQQWTWRMCVQDIRDWGPRILPHLVLKAEQMALLLEACEIKASQTPRKGESWSYNPDNRIRLDLIYSEIRALNTRGREPAEAEGACE